MQRLNEAVYALLDMCPNAALLDIRNDDGQAPIHLAVLTQQPHIVRRLLIAGAKVRTSIKYPDYNYHYCISSESKPLQNFHLSRLYVAS